MVAFVPLPPDVMEIGSEDADIESISLMSDSEISQVSSLHTKIMQLAEVYLAYSLASSSTIDKPNLILIDNSLGGILANSSFSPRNVQLKYGDFDGEEITLADMQVALSHPFNKDLGITSTKGFQQQFRLIAEAVWKESKAISYSDFDSEFSETNFKAGARFLQSIGAGVFDEANKSFSFTVDPRVSWTKTIRIFNKICEGLFREKNASAITYQIKNAIYLSILSTVPTAGKGGWLFITLRFILHTYILCTYRAMTGETTYQLVLLDMDGTFLDSRGKGRIPNEWAYNAFKKTLRQYNITLSSIEEINRLFLDPLRREGAEGVRNFCHRFGLDSEEFWARREKDVIESKIEAMRSGAIKPYKGSEQTLKYLSEKFLLAVVSDSQQACVDYALDYFNLKRYFTIWYGRKSDLESLGNRKPNPFYINRIVRELDVRKQDSILADDSPIGILAARNAGIDSVLISQNERTKAQCESEPTFIIETIGELRKVL
jgi:HAD superfamily hydrolase (TIGR01509 family)